MTDEIRDGAGPYAVRRDTLRDFNAILRRDSKDTTYKFALLRALAELAEQDDHLVRAAEEGWVRFPLGLLVDRWLCYYYPLLARDLPQRHGGGRLSFGAAFSELIAYYTGRGGFAAFWRDYALRARVPEMLAPAFLRLLRALRRTIMLMPMKHLGYSLAGRHYSVVQADGDAGLDIPALRRAGLGRPAVIAHLGDALLRRDFHDTLRALGGFATGTQALMMEWARFTERASARRVTVSETMESLLAAVPVGRDAAQVQRLWAADLARGVAIDCVWTGRRIASRGSLAIDHAIPFSVWGNNDLWNLLPVLARTNAQKSDAIPAPDLVTARQEAIVSAWRTVRAAHEAVFDREFALSLGASAGEAWETRGIAALAAKCRYLVDDRGYPAWRPG